MSSSLFNYELDAKERIIKAKVSLNRERPFFSYIILNFTIEKTTNCEEIPTRAVNQYGDLYWNEDFVNKLQDDELEFVLAHEAMHVSTLTFQREGNKAGMLWNIATDIVINKLLRDEGFNPPKDILLVNHQGVFEFPSGKTGNQIKIDCNNKCAEEVYDALMQHAKEVEGHFGKGDGSGGYHGGLDKHLPGDQNDKGKSQGKNSTAEQNANAQNWKQKAAEGAASAKMRGKGSSSIERMLNNILEPKIDWRKKLTQYIVKELPVDFTMRRPGRRFYATGFYSPSIIKENLELIAGVDCSGSINYNGDDSEGARFMSEVCGIAYSYQQVKLRVIAWADGVLEEDDIEVNQANREMLKTWAPKNNGGTDLTKFTRYCQKKNYTSRLFVILTDGYIENNPKLPEGNILFVLSEGGSDSIIKNYGDVTSLKDIEDNS